VGEAVEEAVGTLKPSCCWKICPCYEQKAVFQILTEMILERAVEVAAIPWMGMSTVSYGKSLE
jgi:hypothetical protein